MKGNNSKSKSSKHIFSWKENFLNELPKKFFFEKNLLKKILFEKTFRSEFFLPTVYYKKIEIKIL